MLADTRACWPHHPRARSCVSMHAAHSTQHTAHSTQHSTPPPGLLSSPGSPLQPQNQRQKCHIIPTPDGGMVAKTSLTPGGPECRIYQTRRRGCGVVCCPHTPTHPHFTACIDDSVRPPDRTQSSAPAVQRGRFHAPRCPPVSAPRLPHTPHTPPTVPPQLRCAAGGLAPSPRDDGGRPCF